MGFASKVGYPYEWNIAWGYPAGAGYPYSYPIVWDEQFAGQHCFFTFYPKATFQADIALKGEHIKTLMADIAISTHFAIKTFTGDVILLERKTKTFHSDIALRGTLTQSVEADASFYLKYSPEDALKAEQKKRSYIPYVKISEADLEASYSDYGYPYEYPLIWESYTTKNRIKKVSHFKSLVKETANIALDNSDQALKDVDMRGNLINIDWGFLIDGLAVTVPSSNLQIMSQVYGSAEGKLICTLECKGITSLMDLDKSSEHWECDENYTVKQLVEGIVKATLAPYNHCTAYDLVVHQTCETYETLKPGTGFFIGLNESRLDVLQFLLSHTNLYMRVENDNKIHLYKDVEHAYTYALDGEHTFFTKDNRKQGVIPNAVYIVSDDEDEDGVPLYSGHATDATSVSLYGEVRWYEQIHVEDNAEATSVAESLLANIKAQEKIVEAVVPMNCFAEVYDKVTITDSREDTEVTGNIGYLSRHYRPRIYRMEMGFGGWFNARKLRDFLKNYTTQPEKRMYFDELPATFSSVRIDPAIEETAFSDVVYQSLPFGRTWIPGKGRLYLNAFTLYAHTITGEVQLRISIWDGDEWQLVWYNDNYNQDMNKYYDELIYTNPNINAIPVVFSVTNLKKWQQWVDSLEDKENATAYFASGFISYDIKGEA